MADATPFHAGELEAQRRAGAGDVASWAGGFIRGHMPDQHRDFFSSLPFLVVSAGDANGRVWTTIVEGADGFIGSPDPKTLKVAASLGPHDPLAGSIKPGAEIGLLGIELATRRRNRLTGVVRDTDGGLTIDVRQSFGNCPQYIHERAWRRAGGNAPGPARVGAALDADQIARIEAADTLFIGSGYHAGDGRPSDGYDASHRGGEPGFVKATADGRLRVPDYAGNNFFNTIGNLLRDPRISLLFVDFETGGLLHVSGEAAIDWSPCDSHDPAARRMIEITIDAVVDRPSALSLRWSDEDADRLSLEVIDKVAESDEVASFHLAAADGASLGGFEPGQHLPIELDIPGQPGPVRRSYSLSGDPAAPTYRISVKREAMGLASRRLHDHVEPGHRIAARRPSGRFVTPCSRCPLVLISAGMGVTPMLSILHAVVAERSGRSIWFVHGARDGRRHIHKAEVDLLLAAGPTSIQRRVFYSRPRDEDRAGTDYDAAGRVTAADVLDLNAGPEAHYMICGPAPFLSDIREGLERGGAPPGQIHFEVFGPIG